MGCVLRRRSCPSNQSRVLWLRMAIMCHASISKEFWGQERMCIALEKRLCMVRIIWPPPSWFARSIGPTQRYSFDYRYFIGSVITIGLSTNGFSQWKSHFDERKQGWLVQKFGLRWLERLSPFHQHENKRRLCSKSFTPGGRGYSLWWPIRGGFARKRYLFQASDIWKRRDFTSWSV